MRGLFKALSILSIIAGVIIGIACAALIIPGIPAFLEMMRGTTAIELAQGNEGLATSFTLASCGIIFAFPSAIGILTGVLGLASLKTGTFDPAVIAAGVTIFTIVFQVIFSRQGSVGDLAIMLYYGIFILLARINEAKQLKPKPSS